MTRRLFVLAFLAMIVGSTALAQSLQRSTIPPIYRDQEFVMSGKDIAMQILNPAAADTDAVHSLYVTSVLADTTYYLSGASAGSATFGVQGTALTLTAARNATVTVSGTQANVDGGDATLYGKNILGNAISETFTFTENAVGTITGNKAFASFDSFTVHTQDDVNVKVSIGIGNKFGLPVTLPINSVQDAWVGSTFEATAPTVAVSATAIESNTVDFNTDPDGTRDYIYKIWVPPFGSTTGVSLW